MSLDERFLKVNPLFKECIEALEVDMLPIHESIHLSKTFKKLVPITEWGKIDWAKINEKIDIGYEPENIIPALRQLIQQPLDTSVYIEWSTMGLPIIKTDLKQVVEVFDYVTCVSFEKFIFNFNQGYVIEVLPNYQITVGLIPYWDNIKSI